MTQSPSPSAAARELARKIGNHRAGLLAERHSWTPEATTEWDRRFEKTEAQDALEIDAFAAQAVAAALTLPPLGERWDYEGEDPIWRILYRWAKRGDDDVQRLFLKSSGSVHPLHRAITEFVAAERAKPAASDHEAAEKLAGEIVHLYGDRFIDALAAALAERGRMEREAMAKWHDHQAAANEVDRAAAVQRQDGTKATWAYHRAGAHAASSRYLRSPPPSAAKP